MNKSNASDIITFSVFLLVVSVLLFLAFFWATAPEQWYAGQHMQGCNNTDNCGCYEKLLQNTKQN